jgi:SAM-dependent methyltransferase
MSAGDSTFNKFDAKAKSEVFAKVFDVGLPMWKTLGLKVAAEMTTKPEKILSVGDGPGEPGCFLAAQFGCEAISSDSVPPMVEAAKKRVAAKGLTGKVECRLLDMQDLSGVDAASCDVVSSAHAYPFAPNKPKALAEAFRVLKPGGVFGAVVWKSFELLPLAGALMGAVTGTPPAPPPAGSPPPPPVAWADPAVTDKLLSEAGFILKPGSEDDITFALYDMDVAMKYCALPVWDRIQELENKGTVPDAWKKYEEAWPVIAQEKGHLSKGCIYDSFQIKAVYRTIVAVKPA